MNNAPKHYYVPWEGGQREGDRLDCLCIQGPHTRERAEEIAKDMRFAGLMASVIDCSETLSRKGPGYREMQEALLWIRDNCTGLPAVARALADKALAKAEVQQ